MQMAVMYSHRQAEHHRVWNRPPRPLIKCKKSKKIFIAPDWGRGWVELSTWKVNSRRRSRRDEPWSGLVDFLIARSGSTSGAVRPSWMIYAPSFSPQDGKGSARLLLPFSPSFLPLSLPSSVKGESAPSVYESLIGSMEAGWEANPFERERIYARRVGIFLECGATSLIFAHILTRVKAGYTSLDNIITGSTVWIDERTPQKSKKKDAVSFPLAWAFDGWPFASKGQVAEIRELRDENFCKIYGGEIKLDLTVGFNSASKSRRSYQIYEKSAILTAINTTNKTFSCFISIIFLSNETRPLTQDSAVLDRYKHLRKIHPISRSAPSPSNAGFDGWHSISHSLNRRVVP